MTPERWQQIRSIYEQASALTADKRLPLLEQVGVADPDLRREVESLLQYEGRAQSSFLRQPAAAWLEPAMDDLALVPRIGTRIGVYQILDQIGHGGMGEVYRAARVDGQYEKQVAIKLVRGGFDSASVIQRFRQERQILASLDHPHIARLLDGGTTDDGIPYLVMELIEGTPIDQYCADRRLSVEKRLELFRKVCAAVQYAHQRLVIHRDLKPGNILVTQEGSPKLLDFGIAKLLDDSVGSEATLLAAMTPEYASPEQVRGDPITTASDVYSLGVVLYRILTGISPYKVTAQVPSKLAQAITETDAERPSSVISRQQSLVRAGSRELDQAGRRKLRRRLSGDIDNIVLKALRKEPARRYLSVDKFEEDIRRHMQGLPVLAVPDSLPYRIKKFIQRNKVGVSAAVLVALAIIGGVSISVRQTRIAEQQRRRAEKRFEDVRKLANSLIFEIHDSIEALPGATPSRRLLLNRAVEYLDSLSQDASGDVNLERELAWAYERLATVQGDTTQSNLGQVSAAEESHRKAMALFEAVGRANPQNVNDQINLAMTYRMRAFFDIYAPAGGAEIQRALSVTDPLMRASGDNLQLKDERAEEELILALIQDAQGDRLKAEDTFRETLRLRQEIFAAKPDYPQMHRKMAKSAVLLGMQIARFGSREQAMPALNQGIAEYEALVKATGEPGVTRELATSLSRRGDAELRFGDYGGARSDFDRALTLLERPARLDPENQMLQSDVWVGKFEIGRALAVSGNNAAALPLLKRAFDGYLSLHLEDDVGPGPGAMQAWIGEAQAGTRQLTEALQSYTKAATYLAENESSFDDARCDLAMVQTKIGNVLVRMGKLEQAQLEYSKALEKSNLTPSLQRMDIPALYVAAEAYAGLGDVAAGKARKTGDERSRSDLLRQARTSYQKSLDVWKRIPNPARYGPNGYLARDPAEVAKLLSQADASELKQSYAGSASLLAGQ